MNQPDPTTIAECEQRISELSKAWDSADDSGQPTVGISEEIERVQAIKKRLEGGHGEETD